MIGNKAKRIRKGSGEAAAQIADSHWAGLEPGGLYGTLSGAAREGDGRGNSAIQPPPSPVAISPVLAVVIGFFYLCRGLALLPGYFVC